jgi:SAM-dependent methyltransferase
LASRTGAAPHSYAIAGGEDGKRRLDLLSDIMRDTTLRLLEDAGLGRGDRVLDVGCGGGHVALDMAGIVGPEGRVLGIDFDPHVLELAREDARNAGSGRLSSRPPTRIASREARFPSSMRVFFPPT